MGDNPFTAKAKKRQAANAFTAAAKRKKAKRYDPKHKARHDSFNASIMTRPRPDHFDWIEEGMKVNVRWPYESHLGNGHGNFTGKVTEIDDWITVVDRSKTSLYMPLFMAGLEIEKR